MYIDTISINNYKNFYKTTIKLNKHYLSLKEIIDNNLSKDNERLSCCERKIFAYLEDCNEKVYSGKLFVKYPPCEECQPAIFYHILNKGNELSMEVGLPNL